MLTKLKLKSEFSRNVLTLMTGTTIAQAIPIAISPILTRIYSPKDFGIFALFIAIVSIFGTISSARYELAIMLPKKDEDAINIFALGFLITLFVSMVLLVIVLIFDKKLVELLGNKEILLWLYFVPISVFFIGIFNLLNYFNTRQKNYKDLARATIIRSIVLAIIQVIVGYMKSGAYGLISGQIISQLFANMKLITNIIKNKILVSHIKIIKIIALAKRYKKFPKYSMFAILANTLSYQLVSIFISTIHSISTLGLYSLVQRVLGAPSSLIGSSIAQVFFKEATIEKQKTGKTNVVFKLTVKKLIIIGVPIYGFIFYIIEDFFAFVFGEEWRLAGYYAQILTPLFFIRFVSSTVSAILTIFEKQKNELFINIILLIISLVLILYIDTFEVFLQFFSVTMSIAYIMFLLYYLHISKG